ncbi:MAG: hypothetical protein ACLQU1_31495 [Bryobacteraceae bacterium]
MGAWLAPLAAAGPLDLTVAGSDTAGSDTQVVHDVLVGEEIAHSTHPLIRLFKLKHAVAEDPAGDVEGAWQICGPETTPRFSAVEYFFGRYLYARHRPTVPARPPAQAIRTRPPACATA